MPPRILIVEDERVLAKNMKTYLSRGARDVRTAVDAAQALEILESFAPDALVLDFSLPDVDGLQTYAEIVRRHARKIDCVLITGNPTEQITHDARELGIRHIVCKPFRFSTLQRLLEEPTAATADDVSDSNK
jgi:DNA-binding response OmpR family regulator